MSRLDFQPALHAYMELEWKQVRNQPNSPESFFVLDRLERRDRAEGEVSCVITLPGELQYYMFLRGVQERVGITVNLFACRLMDSDWKEVLHKGQESWQQRSSRKVR